MVSMLICLTGSRHVIVSWLASNGQTQDLPLYMGLRYAYLETQNDDACSRLNMGCVSCFCRRGLIGE
jgi:hypothetical protein